MNATSTEHTVTLHGHTFSYSDSGSGPALLFIHGLLGSQRQWTHLVDRLDEDHRVIVPDLFGHGESAKPMGDYSLCLLYTSPSPRDRTRSRIPSSA